MPGPVKRQPRPKRQRPKFPVNIGKGASFRPSNAGKNGSNANKRPFKNRSDSAKAKLGAQLQREYLKKRASRI